MKMAFIMKRGGKPGTANMQFCGLARFYGGALNTTDSKLIKKLIESDRFEAKGEFSIGIDADKIPDTKMASDYRMGNRKKRVAVAKAVNRAGKPMRYQPPATEGPAIVDVEPETPDPEE